MKALKILAAATVLIAAASASASAQEFKFDYEPWQLSSSEGRTAVLDRLERRVNNFCRVGEARGALQRYIAEDCQERTLRQALAQMDDTRVLALHRERQLSRSA